MRTGRMIAGLGLGLGLGMLREGANYRQLMIKAGKEPTFDDFWSKSIFGKKKEAPKTEEGVKTPDMSPKATLDTVNKDAGVVQPKPEDAATTEPVNLDAGPKATDLPADDVSAAVNDAPETPVAGSPDDLMIDEMGVA